MNSATLARLRFIDLLLDHHGAINLGTVMDYFGISRPQASLDMRHYSEQAPGNMFYDAQLRAYQRAPGFQRKFP